MLRHINVDLNLLLVRRGPYPYLLLVGVGYTKKKNFLRLEWEDEVLQKLHFCGIKSLNF